MDPQASGSFFSFFSFTTSSTVSLDTLTFEAGQNDTPGDPDRDFEILLSAVDAALPVEGDRTGSLTQPPYTSLATVTVPFGFALGSPPNTSVDVSGNTLTPGTYHIAFALADSWSTSTSALFIDDLTLTAVPEPTTALLLATGLVGLAVRRRGLK